MDDILRFGSQDLFKNEDEDSTKDVDYTDDMVEALLKRDGEFFFLIFDFFFNFSKILGNKVSAEVWKSKN